MQVPFTNHKNHTVHKGGKMVRPGETRHVDASLVGQAPTAAAAAAPDPEAHLHELLEKKVGEISEALSGLSDLDLERLEQIEGDAKKPRKGVLEAIDEEQLNRAKRRQEQGDDGTGDAAAELEAFKAEIREMPDGELDDIRELYVDSEEHADWLAAVDAEKTRRDSLARFEDRLPELTDEELEEERAKAADVADPEPLLAAIDAEKKRREQEAAAGT